MVELVKDPRQSSNDAQLPLQNVYLCTSPNHSSTHRKLSEAISSVWYMSLHLFECNEKSKPPSCCRLAICWLLRRCGGDSERSRLGSCTRGISEQYTICQQFARTSLLAPKLPAGGSSARHCNTYVPGVAHTCEPCMLSPSPHTVGGASIRKSSSEGDN